VFKVSLISDQFSIPETKSKEANRGQARRPAAQRASQPAVPPVSDQWKQTVPVPLPGGHRVPAAVCFPWSETTAWAPAVPALTTHEGFSAHTRRVKRVTAAEKYFS